MINQYDDGVKIISSCLTLLCSTKKLGKVPMFCAVSDNASAEIFKSVIRRS